MNAETSVTTSASSEVKIPSLTPTVAAVLTDLPSRICSWKHSMMRIEESADMPMLTMMPAMPGKVRGEPSHLRE